MGGTAPALKQSAYEIVGRLASLGISKPWQAALYLPSSFIDCQDADEPIPDHEEARLVRWLRVTSQANVALRARRQPMIRFTVEDRAGNRFRASAYGSPEEWIPQLEAGGLLLVELSTKRFAADLYVNIHRVLPDEWGRTLVPVYPLASTKIITQDVLREKILEWLPQSIPKAADHIRHQLQSVAPFDAVLEASGATGWTLEGLLEQAHRPHTIDHGEGARAVLSRLAALGSLHSAKESRPGKEANVFALPDLARCIDQLPFEPTDDQYQAITDISHLIGSSERPIYHVIFGDVGSGKSAVLVVIAAAAAAVGRRTVALFPTSILAQEQYRSFARMFPDVSAELVTGETAKESKLDCLVTFGTSAMLHRKVQPPDILVVDEQHKWSRAQREKLAGPRTHVLEMSATCIPRSQALMRYGGISVSQLRKGHCEKSITTRLWEGREQAVRLFTEIKQDVSEGYSVLMVYPKRKRTEGEMDRSNVYRGMEKWHEQFPGLVRTVTSESSTEEVAEAIEAIKSGAARLLVATTVIEVGVDIPNLRRMVVVDPQRHGLSGLHQLRGRLARQGGEGVFHLVSNNPLPAATRQRVDALMSSTDGFALAEMDLKLRGPGDLRADSKRQAGADGNFLIGQPVELEVYDTMNDVLAELGERYRKDSTVWRE